MNDMQENKGIWAEKLQEISLPDIHGPWQAMEAMLDRELPLTKKRDNRIWLLVLALLLLVGVCNCPGSRRHFTSLLPSEPSSQGPSIPADTSRRRAAVSVPRTGGRDSHDAPVDQRDVIPSGTRAGITREQPTDARLLADRPDDTNREARGSLRGHAPSSPQAAGEAGSTTRPPSPAGQLAGGGVSQSEFRENVPSGKSRQKKTVFQKKAGRLPKISPATADAYPQDGKDTEANTLASPKNQFPSQSGHSIAQLDSIDGGSANPERGKTAERIPATPGPKNTLLSKAPVRTDSGKVVKKPAASLQDSKGPVFAIGINQFFPIGAQQHSGFNSGGTSGALSDYIPVPQGRYYLHRWLYLQAEVQFNVPQYTRTLLVEQQPDFQSGPVNTRATFVKKLFYFNVPLSIHFSPVKHLYVGTGLQYSRLTNAIAIQQEYPGAAALVTGNLRLPGDSSLLAEKVIRLKGDSAYRRLSTSEWRFLFDVNYQWHKLTIGARYNQAFSDFVHVRISGNLITQAHNSSLQCYLRYDLWDRRKKVSAPK